MGRMVYVRDHYINTDDINIIDVNNDGTGTVFMRGGKSYKCTRKEAEAAAGRGVVKDIIHLEQPIGLKRKDKDGKDIVLKASMIVIDYAGGVYYLAIEMGGIPILIPISGRAETNTFRWPETPVVVPRLAKNYYEKVDVKEE